MSAALEKPWTRETFFAWASAREERFEFDGLRPVAMPGGSLSDSAIIVNVLAALRERLRATKCRLLGPDAGVATVRQAVRYPDAVVTCSPYDRAGRLVPDPTTVFKVVSRSSVRIDRILKVEEYRAVSSLRRYVIMEADSPGLLVLSRTAADEAWIATALTGEDTLVMAELGIEIPVAAFYEDVEFPEPGAS